MGMNEALNKKVIMPELTLREWRYIQHALLVASIEKSTESSSEKFTRKRAHLEEQSQKLFELREFIRAVIDPMVEEAIWS